MINNRLREYFTFTKRERNGLIVLLIIMFTLISIRIYQNNQSYGEIVLMDDEFKQEIDEFEKSLVPKTHKKAEKKYYKEEQDKENKIFEVKNLFEFNPNTITKKGLKELGFSDKLVKTIINYRNKGGRFYQKEDFLKITWGVVLEAL
ncbi:helix-hairpin-helix domain-containing protein, partial [Bacteroidota bacterium]